MSGAEHGGLAATAARSGRTPVICLTPVKNEAWILERFLACASRWADAIVVADQGSTDDSVAIARRCSKVTLVTNPGSDYDEGARQRLLLAAARGIARGAVVFALDADEFLCGDLAGSPEWSAVLDSAPGTAFLLRTFNLAPGARRGWFTEGFGTLGFRDDGREHQGSLIHSVRVPVDASGVRLTLERAVLLHAQYLDGERMRSKHRWYECWETLNDPGLSPVAIYRKYHHMDAVPENRLVPLEEKWLRACRQSGIDLSVPTGPGRFWWDDEVLAWFERFTTERFRKVDIWDADWDALATAWAAGGGRVGDPRSLIDRAALAYLRSTQRWCGTPAVRILDGFLKAVW